MIQNIFSYHNVTILEIDKGKKTGKSSNKWKLNNILLNNQWVKEVKRVIRNYLDTDENKNTTYQKPMGSL